MAFQHCGIPATWKSKIPAPRYPGAPAPLCLIILAPLHLSTIKPWDSSALILQHAIIPTPYHTNTPIVKDSWHLKTS